MIYTLEGVYRIEWAQHHFQYYNIQSIDVAQEPRPPADKQAYMQAMRDIGRYWQLTDTRYILGLTASLDLLNAQVDKGSNRFHCLRALSRLHSEWIVSKSLRNSGTIMASPPT